MTSSINYHHANFMGGQYECFETMTGYKGRVWYKETPYMTGDFTTIEELMDECEAIIMKLKGIGE